MTTLLPHPTLNEPLDLSVDALTVDGVPRPEFLEGHLRHMDLSGAPQAWRRVTFDVSARIQPADAAALVTGREDVRMVVRVACVATLVRYGFPLERDPGEQDHWRGAVTLDADDLRGKVAVECLLTGDVGGRPARRLGVSEPWALYADATVRPPFQGTFSVKWSAFEGDDRDTSVPEAAATESFFLDLTGETPIIHLNAGVDGLRQLLDGGDRVPPIERALRESEMHRIVAAAWTSAIAVSTAAINVDEETGEHRLPSIEWRADVLRWALPAVYPDKPLEEAMKQIRRDLDGEEAAVTHAMVQLAVSRHMKAGAQLRKSLKAAVNG
ncbi:hypothetical protein [Patulibacter americanus]|uniref:hypothetical protein n=1 Tax=Patulibacter americanus TaxID=588672 RepID=UPI0003B42442|nr:hypothetical protein [Patulibacter americanus]